LETAPSIGCANQLQPSKNYTDCNYGQVAGSGRYYVSWTAVAINPITNAPAVQFSKLNFCSSAVFGGYDPCNCFVMPCNKWAAVSYGNDFVKRETIPETLVTPEMKRVEEEDLQMMRMPTRSAPPTAPPTQAPTSAPTPPTLPPTPKPTGWWWTLEMSCNAFCFKKLLGVDYWTDYYNNNTYNYTFLNWMDTYRQQACGGWTGNNGDFTDIAGGSCMQFGYISLCLQCMYAVQYCSNNVLNSEGSSYFGINPSAYGHCPWPTQFITTADK